jgi:hypothetical protein
MEKGPEIETEFYGSAYAERHKAFRRLQERLSMRSRSDGLGLENSEHPSAVRRTETLIEKHGMEQNEKSFGSSKK